MERNARLRRSRGAMVQQTAANVGGNLSSQRTQLISAELVGRAELPTGSPPNLGRSNTRQQNDRSSGKPCAHSPLLSRDHAGQHQRMDSRGASPSGTTGSSSSSSATSGTSQGSAGLDSRLASSTSAEPPSSSPTSHAHTDARVHPHTPAHPHTHPQGFDRSALGVNVDSKTHQVAVAFVSVCA